MSSSYITYNIKQLKREILKSFVSERNALMLIPMYMIKNLFYANIFLLKCVVPIYESVNT